MTCGRKRNACATRKKHVAVALIACAVGPCCGTLLGDVPPSANPPGGLAPSNTPQIVLLTFDDAVTTDSFERVSQVMSGFVNPNGQPIKATFFVALAGLYDPLSVRRLYDAGHEIALHTMSHATSDSTSLGRWRQEIAGERRMLSALTGIPADAMVGFRAPFLLPNDNSFHVLAERQFLYDASLPEYVAGLSTSAAHMIWPYTLDHGVAQEVASSIRPATNYPGLFEIPLWVQLSNTTSVALMDPPDDLSSNDVVALWKTNFLAHYSGNRAPYGLFLHAFTTNQWLGNPATFGWRAGALREFIGWALEQTDTWFVSCQDLAGFMQAPVTASEATSSPLFQTPVRTPFPASQVNLCAYPDSHTLRVCGSCPPAAPDYSNAYLGLVPMSGGAVALNIVSQNDAYVWCALTVSNDLSSRIYDWSVRFSLTGGLVQELYDATWSQDGTRVVAGARQYNRCIEAGEACVVTFRVARDGGGVAFSDLTVALSGLGPQPIWLGIAPEGSQWRITWSDQAYLYSVECATNLMLADPWSSVTNGLCQPTLVQPGSTDGAPRFYRVKGTLY